MPDEETSEDRSDSGEDSAERDFLLRVASGMPRGGVDDASCPRWLPERFEVVCLLGEGGFGAVYEVLDKRRKAHVALKCSTRGDRRDIAQLKREFRALSDLRHPNLIQLHELFGDEARCFFTMELVRGHHLTTYVRARDRRPDIVRSVFAQLADAIAFLHRAGRLHRDLKPANVMVDGAGRVVVLDFGLVVGRGDDAVPVAGTPAYMAPEQIKGERLGEAADWYAFGVMLHELLVGRLPHGGARVAVLHENGHDAQVAPITIAGDLGEFCARLLADDPARRPSGDEVVRRLRPFDTAPVDVASRSTLAAGRAAGPAGFFGRRAELAALTEALDVARAGRPSIVALHGASGIGKTALLDRLEATVSGVAVLRARCFIHESVPYKALDGLVDALTRHLSRLPLDQRRAILPADATDLCWCFPALRPLLPPFPRGEGDKLERRRRALAALRETLVRAAMATPLVAIVDDIHWGDAEGAALLASLFARSDAPPMLLVVAYRTDQQRDNPCLCALLPGLRSAPHPFREIVLGPLSPGDAVDFALTMAGDPSQAAVWAAESGGSPLFLRELGQFGGGREARSLDELLGVRVERLSDSERRLLAVVSLAARPISRSAAAHAAALGGDEPAVIGALSHASLVSLRDPDDVEPYHDLVRRAVVQRIDPRAKQSMHVALADALAGTGEGDSEVLAWHLDQGGALERAGPHYAEAARESLEALNWERAAKLFRRALDLSRGGATRAALQRGLGEALSHSGRPADASAAYLDAAQTSPRAESAELHRLAAQHYLTGGYLDEGLRALRPVLDENGLRWPRTRLGILAEGVGRWWWSRGRDLELPPAGGRATHGGDRASVLACIDACTAAALATYEWDAPLSTFFHVNALRRALADGDPMRLTVALAAESCMRAAVRGEAPPSRADARVDALVDRVAGELDPTDPRTAWVRGLVESCRGVCSLFAADLRSAREHLERGQALLLGSPTLVANYLGITRAWLAAVLDVTGQWRQLEQHLRVSLSDARARGDRYTELNLALHEPWLHLVANRPDAARRCADEALERWPRAAMTGRLRHVTQAVQVALYVERGAGEGALSAIDGVWHSPQRVLTTRLSSQLKLWLLHLRGTARLAATAVAGARRRALLLGGVERDAATLARISSPTALAHALVLRAGVAAARGDRGAAIAALAESAAALEALELRPLAAAARRRRGELMRGAVGGAQIASVDDELRAEGVVDPERLVACLLPGRW